MVSESWGLLPFPKTKSCLYVAVLGTGKAPKDRRLETLKALLALMRSKVTLYSKWLTQPQKLSAHLTHFKYVFRFSVTGISRPKAENSCSPIYPPKH